jgi:predicted nucleotidyltransferase
MKNDILNIIEKNSQNIPWLKDNIIFLHVHGSRLYGTNSDTSDWDFRGVCIAPKEILDRM